MNLQKIANYYHFSSGLFKHLPLKWQVFINSYGRAWFLHQLLKTKASNLKPVTIPANLKTTLWGMEFNSPLGNAAGMFKNGEAYDLVTQLGAGFYLGGTSTYNPRVGNCKSGIKLPFVSLEQSKTAINFLGLPNLGDEVLSQKIITQNKNAPLGWSLMRSPDYEEDQALELLIKSLHWYAKNPLIDFIEINESCPNIKANGGKIVARLGKIAQEFLVKTKKPVIIKLSCDIDLTSLIEVLNTLIKYRYSGVTLGNTSTDYKELVQAIYPHELDLYNYFVHQFGGGVSGEVLKQKSLLLCGAAWEYIDKLKLDYEFHIIRSGGVSGARDLIESKQHGVSLNQWYTGFFNNFTQFGFELYQQIYNDLNKCC